MAVKGCSLGGRGVHSGGRLRRNGAGSEPNVLKSPMASGCFTACFCVCCVEGTCFCVTLGTPTTKPVGCVAPYGTVWLWVAWRMYMYDMLVGLGTERALPMRQERATDCELAAAGGCTSLRILLGGGVCVSTSYSVVRYCMDPPAPAQVHTELLQQQQQQQLF